MTSGETAPHGPGDYTRDEERRVRTDVLRGRRPRCPRCDRAMGRRAVPPRPEVAYVRRRSWWLCGGCRRSVVVDEPRLPGRG
jgi:hypothetical protein